MSSILICARTSITHSTHQQYHMTRPRAHLSRRLQVETALRAYVHSFAAGPFPERGLGAVSRTLPGATARLLPREQLIGFRLRAEIAEQSRLGLGFSLALGTVVNDSHATLMARTTLNTHTAHHSHHTTHHCKRTTHTNTQQQQTHTQQTHTHTRNSTPSPFMPLPGQEAPRCHADHMKETSGR